MNYRLIKAYRSHFRVEKMCQILEVSRSGFYAWLKREASRRQQEEQKLLQLIQQIFEDSRQTYGYRRITKALKRQDVHVNRKKVARIMRENNIRPKTCHKFKATTNSKHGLPVAANLLNQNFKAEWPNQVWISDITYVRTGEGWLYLASVEDLCTREVVGWAMAETMHRYLVIQAIKQAIGRHNPPPGVIFHSDRGSQYASQEVQQLLDRYHMVSSMSGKGNCYDNACAESFFATLKKELIYGSKFATRQQAISAIFEYIEVFYNRQRLHSTIGYRTPNEFRQLKKSA